MKITRLFTLSGNGKEVGAIPPQIFERTRTYIKEIIK